MTIARVTVWVAGQVLSASDLNAEFNNIVGGGIALISPANANLAMGGFRVTGLSNGTVSDPSLQFSTSTNTGMYEPAVGQVALTAAGVQVLIASADHVYFPVGLRLPVVSATRTPDVAGLTYFHSGEQALHISAGSVMLRTPAIANVQTADLIVATNSALVSGATTFGRLGAVVGGLLTVNSGPRVEWLPPVATEYKSLQMSGGLPAYKDLPYDAEDVLVFLDDFEGGGWFGGGGFGTGDDSLQGRYWWIQDQEVTHNVFASQPSAPTGGIARVQDQGAAATGVGAFLYSVNGSTPTATQYQQGAFATGKNPVIKFRCAQVGTGAGTRRIGLADNGLSRGEPANFIGVRFTNAGIYTGVVRRASAEATVSLVTAAANGTFNKFKIVVTGQSAADFYVDGAFAGTASSNVPLTTTPLSPAFGVNGHAASQGLDVDYIGIVQQR